MSWCWWDCGDRLTYSQGKWQEFVVTAVGAVVFITVQQIWSRWCSDRFFYWRMNRRWDRMHSEIDREPERERR